MITAKKNIKNQWGEKIHLRIKNHIVEIKHDDVPNMKYIPLDKWFSEYVTDVEECTIILCAVSLMYAKIADETNERLTSAVSKV